MYTEYIAERHHTHLNATQWKSLTDFVHYLGRTGKARISETEEGWFLEYVNRNPVEAAQRAERERQERSQLDAEDRLQRALQAQVRQAQEAAAAQPAASASELRRDPDTKVVFGLAKKQPLEDKKRAISVFDEQAKKAQSQPQPPKKVKQDNWITPGIWAKVITRKLGDGYYKQKGVILEVIDTYTALLELETGEKVKLDQDFLETVIPRPDTAVLVVQGEHRGRTGTVDRVNIDQFNTDITLADGRQVQLDYAAFSKLASSTE